MTQLLRDSIKDYLEPNEESEDLDKRRKNNKRPDKTRKSDSVNPGLLLYKGLSEIENKKSEKDSQSGSQKSKHIKSFCDLPAPENYKRTYQRWFKLVLANPDRFNVTAQKLENRLLIGLSGSGPLETGCALNHNYGMPYIPGSSVKGVVRAWARANLKNQDTILNELLGTEDSSTDNAVSGLVIFHDAWWIPNDTTPQKPFVADMVTTHHPDYYNGGSKHPTDKDSPTPNALVAVQGSFLFVLEGETEHTDLIKNMLEQALSQNGIGAKTAAGYGYMGEDKNSQFEIETILKKNKEASLSNEQKILTWLEAELAKRIDKSIPPKAGDALRERLKEAISDAENFSWSYHDKEQLISIAIRCINYWDPKKKNGMLKELMKKVKSLL